MTRFHPVERRFEAFLRKPLSVRKAMGVIVTATVVSVAIGGVVINLVDAEEFPNVGIGLWWALQTVTTVGYGDVTPQNGYLAGSSTAAANRLLSTVVGAAVGLLATVLIPVPKPPERPVIRAPADPEAV